MKKRNEWIRKNIKRREKKRDHGIADLMMIMHHFFRELPGWINEMEDPRHPSYTIYTQADLVYMGLLKNVCGVRSMHSMDENFNEEACIQTLRLMSGDKHLKEMPHCDTLNYYLMKLSPDCLAGLRKKMVRRLLRMKSFCRGKLLGEDWRIILDGTGLFYFREKHCGNCLVTTVVDENGRKTKRYYHKVLEAKLVLSEDIIISVDTEFIENEKEDVEKQDCEINAAKRLLARLKQDYPRLPVCIQGDSLYEAGPLMAICRRYGWHYIFTHKRSRQQLLDEAYGWICDGGGQTEVQKAGVEKGTGEYINRVEETAGKTEKANIFRYRYGKGQKGKRAAVTMSWVTNIELTEGNLVEMISAGRGRWKIENEGFNNQKNGIYAIGHLNSKDRNGMKNHYLLTQIADIVMQIYTVWLRVKKRYQQSKKNTSSWLLESFRRQPITDEDVSYITRYRTIYLE